MPAPDVTPTTGRLRVALFAGMAEAAGRRTLELAWHGGTVADLRRSLAEHVNDHPIARALWATAVHRVLEQRFPATIEEFLDLYSARVAAHPAWAPDGSSRTVLVDDDLEIVVGFGGRDAGLRLAPRIPSRDRTLPTALLRGPELPSIAEMRELLDDTARRARRVAADGIVDPDPVARPAGG